MSRTHSRQPNKHEKNPNEYSKQYLYNANEPREYKSRNAAAELEVELIENAESMRRSFRHLAHRMRN